MRVLTRSERADKIYLHVNSIYVSRRLRDPFTTQLPRCVTRPSNAPLTTPRWWSKRKVFGTLRHKRSCRIKNHVPKVAREFQTRDEKVDRRVDIFIAFYNKRR